MRIAGTIQDSIVDGEGFRFVVFCQGCYHNCPGCHNPQTHSFHEGKVIDPQELITQMLENPLADGLTLSGGEPFEQESGCTMLAKAAHEHNLNVWCYTGYTFEELIKSQDDFKLTLLRNIDVLIDGRYEQTKRSLALKWRGSTNQRVIDVQQSLHQNEVVLYKGKEQTT